MRCSSTPPNMTTMVIAPTNSKRLKPLCGCFLASPGMGSSLDYRLAEIPDRQENTQSQDQHQYPETNDQDRLHLRTPPLDFLFHLPLIEFANLPPPSSHPPL